MLGRLEIVVHKSDDTTKTFKIYVENDSLGNLKVVDTEFTERVNFYTNFTILEKREKELSLFELEDEVIKKYINGFSKIELIEAYGEIAGNIVDKFIERI